MAAIEASYGFGRNAYHWTPDKGTDERQTLNSPAIIDKTVVGRAVKIRGNVGLTGKFVKYF